MGTSQASEVIRDVDKTAKDRTEVFAEERREECEFGSLSTN
jgi:hypothetical protein